jgi:hypothetical protein
MSADITSATQVEGERPYGTAPDERGSLGTLSWPRAAKVAGLAGAVAALTAASITAGHMAHVEGTPTPVHTTSVIVSPQRAPAP